jgi:hypothetical protein
MKERRQLSTQEWLSLEASSQIPHVPKVLSSPLWEIDILNEARLVRGLAKELRVMIRSTRNLTCH